jgi:hypothetical protein
MSEQPATLHFLLTAVEQRQYSAVEAALGSTDTLHRESEELRSLIEARTREGVGSLLAEGLDRDGPVYPLLMISRVLDTVATLYRNLDCTDAIRDETLFDIRRWIDEHARRSDGEFGLSQVYWIARHLTAHILALNTLQFERRLFALPYRLYRVRTTALLVMVAEAGLLCDQAGYLVSGEHCNFSTTLRTRSGFLYAHAVNPVTGTIEREPRQWAIEKLTLLLEGESEVINIHIPRDTDLSPEQVEHSFALARSLFSDRIPYICVSWLLDPALTEVASPLSNIVQFMNRFAKFAVPFEVPQIYERVFGYGYGQSEVLAHHSTTTLQHNVQRALGEGLVFRTMGGYLAPREEQRALLH